MPACRLQVSFVNSICTVKGGTHVNYVVDQITKCAACLCVLCCITSVAPQHGVNVPCSGIFPSGCKRPALSAWAIPVIRLHVKQ